MPTDLDLLTVFDHMKKKNESESIPLVFVRLSSISSESICVDQSQLCISNAT